MKGAQITGTGQDHRPQHRRQQKPSAQQRQLCDGFARLMRTCKDSNQHHDHGDPDNHGRNDCGISPADGIAAIDTARPEDQEKAGDEPDRQAWDREHDRPSIDGRQIFEAG